MNLQTVWTQRKLFFAVYVNQSGLRGFPFDDGVDFQHDGHDGGELGVREVGNFQRVRAIQQAVELLKLGGHFHVGSRQLDAFGERCAGRKTQFLGGDVPALVAAPAGAGQVVAANHFEGHKDVFTISGDGARLPNHIEAPGAHAVGAVHLDDVGVADSRFFDELEPVAAGAVEGLAFGGNQARNDLVEDRDLVGVPKLDDVRVFGAPDLLAIGTFSATAFASYSFTNDSGK